MGCAIAKVQVDQALIRNSYLFGNTFEVANRILIQPYGYLLLQLRGVRIFARFCKVIFFSHAITLDVLFSFMARCFPSRDDANHVALLAVTMANQNDL